MTNVIEALHSLEPVSGLTHNFYKYPARMSPNLARAVIHEYSVKGDLVLDPFVGGGTTVVEALANGREAIGVDINSIATFVTITKTTPLSSNDKATIRKWAETIELRYSDKDMLPISNNDPRIKNTPEEIQCAFTHALLQLETLPYHRQKRFLRCVLLRLGQWAIDCKDNLPNEVTLREKLIIFIEDMLSGLEEFTESARENGIAKNKITQQRRILLRSSVGLHQVRDLSGLHKKPKLILTSPPYPGVRMLYHRWQVGGRRATPAPYWIINSNDGQYEPYYTMGGTSKSGQRKYFSLLSDIFSSLRQIIDPDGIVIQLISFVDAEVQLPVFKLAMEASGFYESCPDGVDETKLWRVVPGRKWYNRINTDRGTGRELLLFYRPKN